MVKRSKVGLVKRVRVQGVSFLDAAMMCELVSEEDLKQVATFTEDTVALDDGEYCYFPVERMVFFWRS